MTHGSAQTSGVYGQLSKIDFALDQFTKRIQCNGADWDGTSDASELPGAV